MKSAQIEFESMKHEVKRLLEEAEVLQTQTEDANKLKLIAEKQVEDALVALQQEREQRLTLKRELDQLKNAEQLTQLNSLAHSFFGVGTTGDEDGVDSPGVLKQLESAFSHDHQHNNSTGVSSGKGDLFSEVHGAKLDELEAQLEAAQKERHDLDKRYQVRVLF